MSPAGPVQPTFDFQAASNAAEDGEALIIDVDGYEGPLHVLLALARTQKVDLLKLSILKLAEQYLAFVQQARRLRFSLAADYLVMAAWLAYLKSRLLLPKPEKKLPDEAPAEEIAAALAFRLAKLDMMRRAGEALRESLQLGRDVFVRGDPEAIRVIPSLTLDGDLYGLMRAYADQRKAHAARHYRPRAPEAYSLEDARARLRGLLPELQSWKPITDVAPEPERGLDRQPTRASYLASTLSASLELVKEGALEARQLEHFSDLYLRSRPLDGRGMIPSSGDEAEADAADAPALEDVERAIEALLFAAAGPLALHDLARRLPEGSDVQAGIGALRARYAGRGVELAEVAGRWRFQTAQDLAWLMTEERTEPRRLSKAAQEILAIIAYHQPVTRAEMEQIRGVQTSRGSLDVLLELGLVRMRGRRRSPGRPVTYGTTDAFLEHYGLANLADLPGMAEMKAAGLLDLNMPSDFALPDPSQLRDDEDPLEEGDTPEFHQDYLGEDEEEQAD